MAGRLRLDLPGPKRISCGAPVQKTLFTTMTNNSAKLPRRQPVWETEEPGCSRGRADTLTSLNDRLPMSPKTAADPAISISYLRWAAVGHLVVICTQHLDDCATRCTVEDIRFALPDLRILHEPSPSPRQATNRPQARYPQVG